MAEKTLSFAREILGLFPFGALLITWVVEMILSGRWHKKYFTVGIPIFVFHIPVKNPRANIPSCILLENNFKSSGIVIRNTSLLFKEIDVNTVGFRESLLQFGRMYSVMHGLLIFDAKNGRVIVKGFLDWTFLCFAILWIIVGLPIWLPGSEPVWVTALFPLWLVALLYFGILFINIVISCSIDYFRFSRVAKFAAQAWSRQNGVPIDGV
jgi:hypothetical protein